MAVMVP
jgi:hypothetical protein